MQEKAHEMRQVGAGETTAVEVSLLTSGGIKTVGFLCSRDEPGGCPLTGQVVPGIEAA